MRCVILRITCLAISLNIVSGASAQVGKVHSKTPTVTSNFPGPTQVEEVVSTYLASLKKREQNDLISQSDITPVFGRLERIGWRVSDEREIMSKVLKDSDWMVRTLRTKSGTKFMRKMDKFPGGYTQLDLMRQPRQGRKQIEGLIKSPGGEEWIAMLTTSKVGFNTSENLIKAHPKWLKIVEGRLYTKEDFFDRIKASYAADVEKQENKATAEPTPPTPTET